MVCTFEKDQCYRSWSVKRTRINVERTDSMQGIMGVIDEQLETSWQKLQKLGWW